MGCLFPTSYAHPSPVLYGSRGLGSVAGDVLSHRSSGALPTHKADEPITATLQNHCHQNRSSERLSDFLKDAQLGNDNGMPGTRASVSRSLPSSGIQESAIAMIFLEYFIVCWALSHTRGFITEYRSSRIHTGCIKV